MSALQSSGRILKGIGGFYYVDSDAGLVECKARGKFRKLGIKPTVGDIVTFDVQDDGSGYLQEIAPRRNELVRPPIANLDMIVIVASAAPPVTDMFLIDRVSVVARQMGIDVAIAINKCDAHMGDDLFETYTKVGFPVVRVSGKTGEGADELMALMRGKLSAFTGNSGVGKSTILNAIKPDFALETGEINNKIGRGRHTTRHVELYKVCESTWIADTPGFSSFDTERMNMTEQSELAGAFAEFAPFLDECRYTGCSHRTDEGCAVLRAVESGIIPKSRHESYVRLYDSMKNIKSWEKK
ncbi:MAG: ribosome small subunit-dependent GTPase A [Oscillospiraceae bacterium]